MSESRHYFRRPRLSVGQQRAHMMFVWPALTSRLEGGLLVVTGVVRPTLITREYKIRVTYRDRGVPSVTVVSPQLERRPQEPDKPIPHTYDYDTPGKEAPCLYFHKADEWKSSMPIATSIMPWLLSWLVDYEVWHATGEWLGGGMPHGSTKRPDDSSQDEDAA